MKAASLVATMADPMVEWLTALKALMLGVSLAWNWVDLRVMTKDEWMAAMWVVERVGTTAGRLVLKIKVLEHI